MRSNNIKLNEKGSVTWHSVGTYSSSLFVCFLNFNHLLFFSTSFLYGVLMDLQSYNIFFFLS